MSKSADIAVTQQKILQLLRIVQAVCAAEKIDYWVDGGSLLGAKRHGGFIPWDDDVDICIPYYDYFRLLDALEDYCRKSDDKLLYFHGGNYIYWSEYFGECSLLLDGVMPVKVDLCPVKSIAKNDQAIALDKSLTEIARFFIKGSFKYPHAVLEEHRKFTDLSKGAVQAKKDFFDFFNTYCYEESVRMKNEGTNCFFCYSYNDSIVKKERDYFEKAEVFPLSEIEFEGSFINCPNDSNAYLTKLYGPGYMQPPPPEMRVASQQFLYWNKRIPQEKMKWLLDEVYGLSLVNLRLGKGSSSKWYSVINSLGLLLKLLLKGRFLLLSRVLSYSYVQFFLRKK